MIKSDFKKLECPFELYSGHRPETETLEMLYSEGFDCIWNMAKELKSLAEEERDYCPLVLEGKITDYSIPEDAELFASQVEKVCAMLREGKKVFIHCMGGRGRTGMALAGILIGMGGDAHDALTAIYAHCEGPDTEEQVEFIKSLSV